MPTSPGPEGNLPETSVSGLKRWLPWACTLKARPGAPPTVSTLPSRPTSWAVSLIPPAACSTPFSFLTSVSTDSENAGAALLRSFSFSSPIALFAEITTSVRL